MNTPFAKKAILYTEDGLPVGIQSILETRNERGINGENWLDNTEIRATYLNEIK